MFSTPLDEKQQLCLKEIKSIVYPPGITHEDIVEGTVNANILENIKDLHGLVFLKTVLASGMYGEKEKRSCLNYTGYTKTLVDWFHAVFPKLHTSTQTFLVNIRKHCFKDETTLKVDLKEVQVLNTAPFQKCSAPQVKEVKKRRTLSGIKKKAKKAKLLANVESAIEELRDLEAQDDEEEMDTYLENLPREKLEEEAKTIIQLFADSVGEYNQLDDADLRDLLAGVKYCHGLITEGRKK
ncbi:hypothetical protein WA556_003137 [Blastocystis sp. ATCC 50177/Nand II]